MPSCLAQHTCILCVCVLKNIRNLKIKPRCFFSHVRHAVLGCEAERSSLHLSHSGAIFLGYILLLFDCVLLLDVSWGPIVV